MIKVNVSNSLVNGAIDDQNWLLLTGERVSGGVQRTSSRKSQGAPRREKTESSKRPREPREGKFTSYAATLARTAQLTKLSPCTAFKINSNDFY